MAIKNKYWQKQNHEFHKKKSQTLVQDFWLNGEKLEIVDSYVYLGSTFQSNGKFTGAIEKQIN